MRILISFFIGLFVFCVRSSAESTDSTLKDLRSKVAAFKLRNGIRVTMYQRGVAPVFSGAVIVKVGGIDEEVGETGISHMFEHMAFKGTKTIGTQDYGKEKPLLDEVEKLQIQSESRTLTEQELKRLNELDVLLRELWVPDQYSMELDNRGGTSLNAQTDKELTKYFVSLPRPAFEYWCWIESERFLNPVMRQFYTERDVVMEERRMRFEDDPGGKLYENLLFTAYTTHPYRNPVIGYAPDIKGLTATKLDAFRKEFYVPSNIAISVVGDVSTDRDRGTIEKYFGRIPKQDAKTRSIEPEPVQKTERKLTVKMDSAPQFFVAYHKPAYPDPLDPPLSIMEEILAGSVLSPLYEELVTNLQIASSVDVQEAPGISQPNLIMFSVIPIAGHSNEEVLGVFDRIIKEFQSKGPSEEQLLIAKRSVTMDYLGQLKSNLGLAKNLASSELLYGSWTAMLDWYDQSMNVSREQVKDVSQRFLNPEQRTIAFLESSEGGEEK